MITYLMTRMIKNATVAVSRPTPPVILMELINKICAYLVGICFWAGLIAGYIVFAVINSKRKKQLKKKKESAKSLPGIICFFSNKYAKVFDILFVISLILSVVFMFIPALNQGFVSVLVISVCVFSLHMHSILNGVNYKYIQNLEEE